MLRSVALALLLTAPSYADPAGDWVVRVKNRPFLTLHVVRSGQGYTATMHRPAHFQVFSGGFTKISPEHVEQTWQGTLEGSDDVTWQGKDGPTKQHGTGPDTATLLIDGAIDPWFMERASGTDVIPTQWPSGLSYQAEPEVPDNAELQAAFDKDQKDRTTQPIDWPTVSKTDALHREQTREWLAKGQIRTATDFRNASFIFQHSNEANDYLLAHTLALVAVQKGDRGSAWIAAATLDRYLQSVGQKQIYGTQYRRPAGSWTQEPSDETLIPEALLKQLGVPDRAHQRQRLLEMEKN